MFISVDDLRKIGQKKNKYLIGQTKKKNSLRDVSKTKEDKI
jgi:hypothetical protein